jgi:mannose-6-phosphate isomerase-like protein (cupin superfamily)
LAAERVLHAGEGPVRPLASGRGVSRAIVDGETCGATRVDMHVNVLEPGRPAGPAHWHREAENVYWVLEGTVEVDVEGRVHRLGPDQVIFIPPGVVHATSNPGDTVARMIEIYAPAGADFHRVDGG